MSLNHKFKLENILTQPAECVSNLQGAPSIGRNINHDCTHWNI